MEDENDECWLYGNSEGKEGTEQPPGTENDAVASEKPDGSKENDSGEVEAQPAEDLNENQVIFTQI